MKIVLTTMPREGEALSWTTPKYFQPEDTRYMPLGLLSLASNIPKEYRVKVLDPLSTRWSLDRTVEEIEKEKPDILGLSVMTVMAYPMTEILKRTSAQYKIVGGPHATYNSEFILKQGADAVFIGQLADKEFSEAIQTRPKGIIRCETRVKEINFPDRTLIDVKFYFPDSEKTVLFKAKNRLTMFSSIGCPYRCKFCDVQTKKPQRKKAEKILDEMIYLNSLGSESTHMLDDCFNTNENHLRAICNEMDRRGYDSEWSGRGQPRMSSDIAKMLAERKFKRMHTGFEALTDRTLSFFNKPYRAKQIERFCEIMNSVGIDILGYFIIGAPTETEEDRKMMASKIKSLGIKYPFFNILMPLPNTEYYNSLLSEGYYDRDYWAEFVRNPVKDFTIPFPYGEKKHEEDVSFVTELINEFKK